MNKDEIFGANMRTARIGKGWTQADLAKVCGIPLATVSWYERGNTIPEARGQKIAEALGTTVDELHKNPAIEVKTSVEPIIYINNSKNEANIPPVDWWEIVRQGEVLPMVDGSMGLRIKNPALAKLVKMEHKYRELLDEPDNDFIQDEYNYLMKGQFERFRRDINA